MNPGKPDAWASALPDVLAFALGLSLAWWLQWDTTDLVWSLWLASLCVGYSIIVWSIFRPLVAMVEEARENDAPPLAILKTAGVLLLGALFMLAFFTVHFGGFHFVHSVFLHQFFPVLPEVRGGPGLAVYAEVFERYWIWLPAAFLAERRAFRLVTRRAPKTAHGAIMPQPSGETMLAPYKNVIRMHLLIFFFAFASFKRLDHFAVYAAVYAVYFFPWSLLSTRQRQMA